MFLFTKHFHNKLNEFVDFLLTERRDPKTMLILIFSFNLKHFVDQKLIRIKNIKMFLYIFIFWHIFTAFKNCLVKKTPVK